MKKTHQIAEAQRRQSRVETYRQLMRRGLTPNRAVAEMRRGGLDVSRASLDRWSAAFSTGGFTALVDKKENSGRKRNAQIDLLPSEKTLVKSHTLITNRDRNSGSVPEAIRRAALDGNLRPEVAEAFLQRDRASKNMVPEALRRELMNPPSAVHQHRNPTNASLDYLSCPGSTMFVTNEFTGEKKFVEVGDILEADDATINFVACVPWPMRGCPCSERYGVKVGRFQWLVAIDVASRFIPGWSYTARDRSSYRAEDVTSLFLNLFKQHGVWKRARLERGVWESNLVGNMLERLEIERLTAWSPHQKPYIEGTFNSLWTKLSFMPGQVGRFRGEEEEVNRILTSCRSGATDPRKHFPMLPDLLAGLTKAVSERNAQAVHTENWGSWVPQERWELQMQEAKESGRLRSLSPESSWLFAPCVRTWTVQGGIVGGKVPVLDGVSIPFEFGAPFLPEFSGHKVKVYFDPLAPNPHGTVVLDEPVRDYQAGHVLGSAFQVNETTRQIRMAMGYGFEGDLGMQVRKATGAALVRSSRAILPNGRPGIAITEVRSADGTATRIETDGTAPATPQPQPGHTPAVTQPLPRNPLSAPTQDEYAAQRERRRQRAATAAALETISAV